MAQVADSVVKTRGVLFLCVGNSARSQMAEGFARKLLSPKIRVQSAGSQPTAIHPLTIEVMTEAGIDMSGHQAKSVDDIDPDAVDLVITLCADEVCPVVFGDVQHLHWPIADPGKGNPDDTRAACLPRFQQARDEIKVKIEALAKVLDSGD